MQWWKVDRQVGRDELEDLLGMAKVFERVRAEIAHADRRRQLIAHQLLGRQREQDLAAVCGCKQSGDAIERWTEVIAVTQFGDTGVQGDAHAQLAARSGWFSVQRSLKRQRGIDCRR